MLIFHCLTVVQVSFCSLIKVITPKICMLCFVLINSVILNLLSVWISPVVHTSWLLLRRSWFLSYRWGRWAGRHALWVGTCCQSAPRCGCRGWGLASVAGCCTAQCSGSTDGTPSRSGTNVPAPAIHKEHQCKNTSCNITTWSSLLLCKLFMRNSPCIAGYRIIINSSPRKQMTKITTWSSLLLCKWEINSPLLVAELSSIVHWESKGEKSPPEVHCYYKLLLSCKWEIHSPLRVAALSSTVHWEGKGEKVMAGTGCKFTTCSSSKITTRTVSDCCW